MLIAYVKMDRSRQKAQVNFAFCPCLLYLCNAILCRKVAVGINKRQIMVEIGTVFTQVGKKALLCGSGELGKEVAIELQRYGIEVVALDKYANAPAMQIAQRSHVLPMLDGQKLREVIEAERPDYIIPEVEAIATSTLVELEKEGYHVVPTARAAYLTMNREGIRRLAAEELGLDHAWHCAQEGGRAGAGRVIVEGFVRFDYEITLLTVRHSAGTTFLNPIGHIQVDGDYRESWQPQAMSSVALAAAQDMARKVTDALGGYGIFGVEMFVCGDKVLFSEVSPRPHDTGMVTMISQDLSEFALHARALVGLPIPSVRFFGPSASRAIVVEGDTDKVVFGHLEKVLEEEGVQIRIFGKPEVVGHRRLGVILATADTVEEARAKAERAYNKLAVTVLPR